MLSHYFVSFFFFFCFFALFLLLFNFFLVFFCHKNVSNWRFFQLKTLTFVLKKKEWVLWSVLAATTCLRLFSFVCSNLSCCRSLCSKRLRFSTTLFSCYCTGPFDLLFLHINFRISSHFKMFLFFRVFNSCIMLCILWSSHCKCSKSLQFDSKWCMVYF